MDSMIKEINENLKTIIDTIRENRDSSISTLDNIQSQMDKKVEEAKKYKIQVDSAKEKINELEQDNKSLELSLKELQDKYGKMNLVSIIEAGNREIKTKINDNLININKQKEHIAELTNRARTIKDLLINLKKDKTIKEERLENIKVVYDYYSERVNDVIDYAFNHSNNLSDFKSFYNKNIEDEVEINEDASVKSVDLENTMVFDEIANIDENKNFKDEMSFINDQIDNDIVMNDNSLSSMELEDNNSDETSDIDNEILEVKEIDAPIDTTQVFDSILNEEENLDNEDNKLNFRNDLDDNKDFDTAQNLDKQDIGSKKEINSILEENVLNEQVKNELDKSKETSNGNILTDNLEGQFNNINTDIFQEDDKIEDIQDTEESFDDENKDRIDRINDLFSSINNSSSDISVDTVKPFVTNEVEKKIDDAYKDIFGAPLDEKDLNKKESTLTDIFGNPISSDELSDEVKIGKKIEDLFNENGIEFNKFREDEKNYLKQIYDEEKFNNIINILKRNKINLENLYHAFNIFGEISANELENLVSKLLNIGQSVEAIGIILEKLPKVKKYNLDEAIISYGEYVKDIDISELIMKAKELYNNGGNR